MPLGQSRWLLREVNSTRKVGSFAHAHQNRCVVTIAHERTVTLGNWERVANRAAYARAYASPENHSLELQMCEPGLLAHLMGRLTCLRRGPLGLALCGGPLCGPR